MRQPADAAGGPGEEGAAGAGPAEALQHISISAYYISAYQHIIYQHLSILCISILAY